MHKYTNDEIEFLKNNVHNRSYKDITKLFNKHFNLNLPVSTVTSTCFRYGFKNGIDAKFNKGCARTQFKKGNIPFNKGTKGLTSANKTSFKKGNMPPNHRPVGSERISKDGYIEIKVAEPKKWRLKHIVIFEQANGPIPKGHAVIFLDQDKTNLSIDNLKLITRRELLVMNKNDLFYKDSQATNSATVLAKTIIAYQTKARGVKDA